jgi:hypothetical protein
MGADGASDADRLTAWALRLERRLGKLCTRCSRLDEDLSTLELEFRALARALSGAPPLVPQPRRPLRRAGGDWAIADRGVSELLTDCHGDESMHVRFDGSEPVKLTRALAHLLDALARDAPSTDHLVGWKPIEEVMAELAAREEAPVGRRAVRNRMWNLRRVLIMAGLSAGFVQSHPRKGVRFALRRPAARAVSSVSGSDP